jgi:hypothetical protein
MEREFWRVIVEVGGVNAGISDPLPWTSGATLCLPERATS